MIPVESIIMFITASALLAVVPGPDNLFVLTQSAIHGRAAGIMLSLGLCTGLIVHTSAVALGVAAIFQTSVVAFTVLKVIGAIYLVYLAVRAFQASADSVELTRRGALSLSALYRRGILMNITNPKVSIFFLAFLPQFVVPEKGAFTQQVFMLGGVFMLVALAVLCVIAMLAAGLGYWLNRSPVAQLYLNRLAGVVFIGLALKLATSKAIPS
ncbi:LysE family translocator [Neptuniibacter sp. 2_MG-2023]|uniref:LysE family translocator n=1 Tax=Neptuniibacter sp. 2_MG-2023 TaxID=3062671 RepID=UPI0026E2F5DE|nr:LysE family translocator [Neptuniibacter sp. 2_MG-2023]MDO6512657.1 LysE family translocator [Neptuniibacter sp. 2_MG-2023]